MHIIMQILGKSQKFLSNNMHINNESNSMENSFNVQWLSSEIAETENFTYFIYKSLHLKQVSKI